jgi:hypothetical protein
MVGAPQCASRLRSGLSSGGVWVTHGRVTVIAAVAGTEIVPGCDRRRRKPRSRAPGAKGSTSAVMAAALRYGKQRPPLGRAACWTTEVGNLNMVPWFVFGGKVHVRPARSIFSNAPNFRCSAIAALVRSP